MNDSGEKSLSGTGGWMFLVFLAVLAFHVVAILGIAIFNGWKFNGTNAASQVQNAGPAQPQPTELAKSALAETALAPAPKIEPAGSGEKDSSRRQTALEKQILSEPDDEAMAIPAPVVPEPAVAAVKKEEPVKAIASAADAAVHEKITKKVSPQAETVKKTDHSDIGLVESGPSLAMTMKSSKEKAAASAAKNAAGPILVPAKKTLTSVSGKAYGTYTVQKGDTLNKIARQFNTTLENLSRLNSIKDPNGLKYGMTIKVPGK